MFQKKNEIASQISEFCDKNPSKLQGFLCDDVKTSKRVLYCILVKFKDGGISTLNKSKQLMIKLMRNVQALAGEVITVGIAKMNEWETYDEWKLRAFNNIITAREKGQGKQNEKKHLTGFGDIYSDVEVEFTKPKDVFSGGADEKAAEIEINRDEQLKLGIRSEFEARIRDTINKKDKNWVIAIMSVDNLDEILTFATVEKQITRIVLDIFNAFDNNNNSDKRYFGYKITEEEDVYGMVLYDHYERKLNDNVPIVSAHDVLEALRLRINHKCSFSVSIGYDRIVDQDDLIGDDLIERVHKHLIQAKKSANNQVVTASVKKVKAVVANVVQQPKIDPMVFVLCLFVCVVCLFALFCKTMKRAEFSSLFQFLSSAILAQIIAYHTIRTQHILAREAKV